MSLRYASRLVYQASMRVLQGMKDQTSTTAIKSLRDSTCSSSSSSSSSKQVRRFSGGLDSTSLKSGHNPQEDKLKQAEESLRTVMYLSFWGPN